MSRGQSTSISKVRHTFKNSNNVVFFIISGSVLPKQDVPKGFVESFIGALRHIRNSSPVPRHYRSTSHALCADLSLIIFISLRTSDSMSMTRWLCKQWLPRNRLFLTKPHYSCRKSFQLFNLKNPVCSICVTIGRIEWFWVMEFWLRRARFIAGSASFLIRYFRPPICGIYIQFSVASSAE